MFPSSRTHRAQCMSRFTLRVGREAHDQTLRRAAPPWLVLKANLSFQLGQQWACSRDTMKHKTTQLVLCLFIVSTIVGGAVYWRWPEATPTIGPSGAESGDGRPEREREAAPRITWTPASVKGEVGRGERKSVKVTFVASENAQNVTVRVVPELQPIVSTSPSAFPNLEEGKTYTMTVTFAASSSAPIGLLDGVIQLRTGPTLARPLPVKVVVTVVPLPPDPGKRGKATLEGIDADRDGMRDDVQRFIALTYPDSEKTRLALSQYAQAVVSLIVSSQAVDPSTLGQKLLDGIECLHLVRPDDATKISRDLGPRIYNTRSRYREYLSGQDKVSGQSFIVRAPDASSSACRFDLNAVTN